LVTILADLSFYNFLTNVLRINDYLFSQI
jgi:hypothetical protein